MKRIYTVLNSLIAGLLLFFLLAAPTFAQEESLVKPEVSSEPTPTEEPIAGPPQPTPGPQPTTTSEASSEPSPTPSQTPLPESTSSAEPSPLVESIPSSPQPAVSTFISPSPLPTQTLQPQNGFDLFSWAGFLNLDRFFDQFWGTRFQSSMDGAQIVGKPGDPDGVGQVMLETYPSSQKVCIVIKTTNLDQLSGAAIHWGAFGVDDQSVVRFPMIISDGVGSGCVQVDYELLKDIRKNPFNYYMNLTTTTYPDGAIRGQLSRQ